MRKTEATGERRLAEKEGGTREREDEERERERTREKSGARWRRTERGNCGVTRRKRG